MSASDRFIFCTLLLDEYVKWNFTYPYLPFLSLLTFLILYTYSISVRSETSYDLSASEDHKKQSTTYRLSWWDFNWLVIPMIFLSILVHNQWIFR